MITQIEHFLAKKYAKAFLASLQQQLSFDAVVHIKKTVELMHTQKECSLLFLIPTIPTKARANLVGIVLAHYQLPACLHTLFLLLMAHHRFSLVPAVLTQIVNANFALQRITPITIKSSSMLSLQETKEITQFVESKLPTTVYA